MPIHSCITRHGAKGNLALTSGIQTPAAIVMTLLVTAAWPASAQEAKDAGHLELERITVEGRSSGSGLDLHAPSNAGSRLGLSSFETPASVQVIKAETIRQRGQRGVNQAIAQNGTGISFHGAPGNGGTSFTVRGFSGHGSVTRLYDGTRLYPGSGTITFPFDSWNIDRIEILNGPASVLYGEGAVGGAINIVPKRPLTDSTRNEARATVGNYGQRALAVGSAGPINDALAYSFDVSGAAADGWRDRDNTSSLSISAALRWQASEDLAFTLSHDYGKTRPSTYFGTPLIDGRVDKRVRRRNYNVSDSLVRFRDNYTQLHAEWGITENVTVNSRLYRLASDRDWRNVEDYLYRPATDDVLREFYIAINHDLEQVGNRTDARIETRPAGMENTTTIGFDLNRIKFKNTNNSPYAGSSVVDFLNPEPGVFGPHVMATTADLTTDQYALFLDNRLKINDQFSLVGGVRYDHLRISRVDPEFSRNLSSVNWRVGAVYNPIPEVALYAQYSRAHEPIGNVLSLAQSQADLKLTEAQQQEIGVKFNFLDGKGDATLAAYRIVKNDLLARDPDDPSVTRQIGQQSSKGIEAALGFDLTPSLRLDANGALLSPRYDDYVQPGGDFSGNRPPNAPRHVVNIWGSWAFAPGWTARAGAHHVGGVYTNDSNTTTRPSYTVVNAGLQWKPRENLSLDLNVYNLTDKVYATSGGSDQWLLAPPRSATLDLSVTF